MRPQRPENVLVQLERRQDDDLRRIGQRGDPPGRVDTVEARHAHVHQDHVGPVRLHAADRAGPTLPKAWSR
jgi:hypothetical protein